MALAEGKQIIIGTPGRVKEMLQKGHLKSQYLKLLILDEADQMLDRGFKDQIGDVLKLLPADVQIGLFSATMPKEILQLTKDLMREPATILVKNEDLTLDGIRQFYLAIGKEEFKFPTLVELYNTLDIAQGIIYCNSKKKVDEITALMRAKKFTVSAIHSEMDADTRSTIMKEFRTGSTRVLISTDLTARGIDVQQVNLVINYELPLARETYIHRIGRAGRYGKKGVAINFVTPYDAKLLKEVEQFYNTQVEKMPVDVTDLFE
jgi:translation initiation factor 4A